MRVLYLTNVPSPYRIDFFNEMGKSCDLTVIYERASASDRDPGWTGSNEGTYKEIFLKGVGIRNDDAFSFEIIKYLSRRKFDFIIVGGYATPTAMLAILWMRLNNINYIINADGGIIKNDPRAVYNLKKFLIGGAKAWLSSGDQTNQYLQHYGADSNSIYKYPFTSLHEKEILRESVSDIEKDQIKEKLGLSGKKIVLTVGQFIHRKGYDVLLKAWGDMGDDGSLYLVGGTQTEEYNQIVKEADLKNVFFIPFKNKKELSGYYKAADIFVLPTREDIWGLVINEAMAFGLPVITTDKCLAGLELIRDGQEGFIIQAENTETLHEKMRLLLDSDELRSSMSKNCLHRISEYTIDRMAQAHIEILNMIKGRIG
ncbi:MAG: glycosyltransferase family 4 protein [Eubacteriales bacterium]|nr:glycosyltransferase family 4 protein [Eubacteriales bacterium]